MSRPAGGRPVRGPANVRGPEAGRALPGPAAPQAGPPTGSAGGPEARRALPGPAGPAGAARPPPAAPPAGVARPPRALRARPAGGRAGAGALPARCPRTPPPGGHRGKQRGCVWLGRGSPLRTAARPGVRARARRARMHARQRGRRFVVEGVNQWLSLAMRGGGQECGVEGRPLVGGVRDGWPHRRPWRRSTRSAGPGPAPRYPGACAARGGRAGWGARSSAERGGGLAATREARRRQDAGAWV